MEALSFRPAKIMSIFVAARYRMFFAHCFLTICEIQSFEKFSSIVCPFVTGGQFYRSQIILNNLL